MATRLDLQNPAALAPIPAEADFRRWVEAALERDHAGRDYAELEQTIRIVDAVESEALNREYRGKAAPTNVLAFPGDDALLDYACLGDLVICAPLVAAEAAALGKPVDAHWAHLVVHGMLHLQGYDHDADAAAARMEAREAEILGTLGYTNPYNE